MSVDCSEKALIRALTTASLAKKEGVPEREETGGAITFLQKTVGKSSKLIEKAMETSPPKPCGCRLYAE